MNWFPSAFAIKIRLKNIWKLNIQIKSVDVNQFCYWLHFIKLKKSNINPFVPMAVSPDMTAWQRGRCVHGHSGPQTVVFRRMFWKFLLKFLVWFFWVYSVLWDRHCYCVLFQIRRVDVCWCIISTYHYLWGKILYQHIIHYFSGIESVFNTLFFRSLILQINYCSYLSWHVIYRHLPLTPDSLHVSINYFAQAKC